MFMNWVNINKYILPMNINKHVYESNVYHYINSDYPLIS